MLFSVVGTLIDNEYALLQWSRRFGLTRRSRVRPPNFDHCDDAYSLSIRVQTTLNHIRFISYHNIKDNERDLCQDLFTIENTDSDLKVHALHYVNELLVRVRLSFQKLLQTRSTCRNNKKNMCGKRVMTRSRCR